MKRCMLVLAGFLLSWTASVSAQEWAKARLDNSPRHLEWITVKHGDREVKCFVAFPEVKERATAVVVIHEIFGLTNWVRGVTDQLGGGRLRGDCARLTVRLGAGWRRNCRARRR